MRRECSTLFQVSPPLTINLFFKSVLDDVQDLVQERDAYKFKLHRLNHSMGTLLKNDSHKSIDLDWLLSENR